MVLSYYINTKDKILIERKTLMDYKLKNGFVIKLATDGEEVSNTYLEIKATGFHGDADYDVNNETKLYFNDNENDFKELVSFICFRQGLELCELKEDYQKLFKGEKDFRYNCKEWVDFCSDYSEVHDERISLDTKCLYLIEGKNIILMISH